MKKIKFSLSICCLVLMLASVAYYNYYALIKNTSGHTGLDLTQVKLAYLAFSILTLLIGRFDTSDQKTKKICIVASLIGFIFIANIWIFEKAEILLFYNDWTKCCM